LAIVLNRKDGKMASGINWKMLKQTEADGQLHSLDKMIYRHHPADKLHCERIFVEIRNGGVWACYRKPQSKSGWGQPFKTVGKI